jgi:hypothetical protein
VDRIRRHRLGAEELIELGQAPAARALPVSPERNVVVTRSEGQLLVRVVENVVSFAQGYPLEFNAYCPPERWQTALSKVGTWTHEIERQLNAGAASIVVPAEAVFHLVDLEKCVSAVRDARLSSAKLAFMISAGGAIAQTVLGISWIGLPAYATGLAILFGRPLLAKYNPEPQEPYKPALTGKGCGSHALGDHTDKRKVLERVITCPEPRLQRHHWGSVRPFARGYESAVCLAKGRFRVRVEGWMNDTVVVAAGWSEVELPECETRRSISVWEPADRNPRLTPFGAVPSESGFEDTFWVEYTGPLTAGVRRRAGPFG